METFLWGYVFDAFSSYWYLNWVTYIPVKMTFYNIFIETHPVCHILFQLKFDLETRQKDGGTLLYRLLMIY